MWKIAGLLLICGIAWGILSLFEQGTETIYLAVMAVGLVLGYMYSVNNEPNEEEE